MTVAMIYIHIHTYAHIYTYTHICTHIHIYTHKQIRFLQNPKPTIPSLELISPIRQQQKQHHKNRLLLVLSRVVFFSHESMKDAYSLAYSLDYY
jgi:hypothetical protein